MIRIGTAALAALLAAGVVHAAELTPLDIVKRHTSSGGDIDKIMADYADDAVVLQNGRAIQGKPAIRKLFEAMFGHHGPATPKADGASDAPPAGPPAMKVTRTWQEGSVGFMTWEMGPVHTTEEFIVKDGKIKVQAIFMTGGGMGSKPAGQ